MSNIAKEILNSIKIIGKLPIYSIFNLLDLNNYNIIV